MRGLLCLLGAAAIASTAVLLYMRFPPTDSASGAAWVQAIGSIIAIAIAIWVPTYHSHLAEAKAEAIKTAKYLDCLMAVRRLLAESLRYTRALCKQKGSKDPRADLSASRERCRDLIARASAIPIEQLPERYMAYSFDLRTRLFDILQRLEAFSSVAHSPSDEDWAALIRHRDGINKMNAKAKAFYDISQERLGVTAASQWPHVWAHQDKEFRRSR